MLPIDPHALWEDKPLYLPSLPWKEKGCVPQMQLSSYVPIMTSWLSEENHKAGNISVFFVLLMVVELVLAPGSLSYIKDRQFHGV